MTDNSTNGFRCQAYKLDGTLCGAIATHINKDGGFYVCDECYEAATARAATSLAAPPGPQQLSAQEQTELDFCERIIQEGLDTFVQVGHALWTIREKRLYRGYGWQRFEDYVSDKWGMSARHAHRLCQAAEITRNLSAADARFLLPATESQTRPLAGLTPEFAARCWQEALVTAPEDGKITARHVSRTVNRLQGRSEISRPVGETAQESLADSGSESPGADNTARRVGSEPFSSIRPAGNKENLLREAAEAAIAQVIKLQDLVGTPDSAQAADLINALRCLQDFKEHLHALQQMHASRAGQGSKEASI